MSPQPAPPVLDQHQALVRSLTNITPDAEQVKRIESIREAAKLLGGRLIATAPPGRERSLAITHLEETTMWAVKAVLIGG